MQKRLAMMQSTEEKVPHYLEYGNSSTKKKNYQEQKLNVQSMGVNKRLYQQMQREGQHTDKYQRQFNEEESDIDSSSE